MSLNKILRYTLAVLLFLAGLALIVVSLVVGPVVGGSSVFWVQLIVGAALMAIAFKSWPRLTKRG